MCPPGPRSFTCSTMARSEACTSEAGTPDFLEAIRRRRQQRVDIDDVAGVDGQDRLGLRPVVAVGHRRRRGFEPMRASATGSDRRGRRAASATSDGECAGHPRILIACRADSSESNGCEISPFATRPSDRRATPCAPAASSPARRWRRAPSRRASGSPPSYGGTPKSSDARNRPAPTAPATPITTPMRDHGEAALEDRA